MTMSHNSDRAVEELVADLKTFHMETAQAVVRLALRSILNSSAPAMSCSAPTGPRH